MANFSPYLLVAWVLVVLVAFPAFQKHRAVIAGLLVGLLYLPEVGSQGGYLANVFPVDFGPLKFTKDLTVNYALLFAVLIYDSERVLTFRPSWFDLPLLVWCACPVVSAFANEP